MEKNFFEVFIITEIKMANKNIELEKNCEIKITLSKSS